MHAKKRGREEGRDERGRNERGRDGERERGRVRKREARDDK